MQNLAKKENEQNKSTLTQIKEEVWSIIHDSWSFLSRFYSSILSLILLLCAVNSSAPSSNIPEIFKTTINTTSIFIYSITIDLRPLNISAQKTHTISYPTKANKLYSTQSTMNPNFTFPANSLNTSGQIGSEGNPHLDDATCNQYKPFILCQNGSPKQLSKTTYLDGESRNNASDTKSFHQSSNCVSGDEENHGDLQQPSMNVDYPSTTNSWGDRSFTFQYERHQCTLPCSKPIQWQWSPLTRLPEHPRYRSLVPSLANERTSIGNWGFLPNYGTSGINEEHWSSDVK